MKDLGSMPTVRDTIAKITLGSKLYFRASWAGEKIVKRTVTELRSREFGLSHPTREATCYCRYPKKAEVTHYGFQLYDFSGNPMYYVFEDKLELFESLYPEFKEVI